MKHAAAFMSQETTWETPQAFFDHVNCLFRFTLDACATADNAKCEVFYSPEDDALSQPWPGVVWMNPPYSHSIGKWVEKAYREAQAGATVVALIPARTETSWWHDYVMKANKIILIRGRMRFSGSPINAPFPSSLVVFEPGDHRPVFETMDRILDSPQSVLPLEMAV